MQVQVGSMVQKDLRKEAMNKQATNHSSMLA